MKLMTKKVAAQYGFSSDKRKRRNQHRNAAKNLLSEGGFFNGFSARGSTFGQISIWHLYNARYLG